VALGEENLMNHAQSQAVNENLDKHPSQQSASTFHEETSKIK
jgi:hypothetical protein